MKAINALIKLKQSIDISYFISPAEYKAIEDACNLASEAKAAPVKKTPVKKVSK